MAKTIKERTADYNFPVLINVDTSHTDPMITVPLPLGVRAKIDSPKNSFEIIGNGVIQIKSKI